MARWAALACLPEDSLSRFPSPPLLACCKSAPTPISAGRGWRGLLRARWRARRRVGPAGGRPEAQIPLKPTRGRGPLTFQGRTQTLTKRLLLPSERPPNTCQHLPKHLNLAENTCAPQYPHVRLPLSAPLSLPPPNAALYAEIFWFVLLLAPFVPTRTH